MDTCLNDATVVGLTNYTLLQFAEAYSRNLACGVSQYLRPDVGGALVPWIWSMIVIVVHAPVLWERIHDWEKVQTFSLCLAFCNIVVTVASYWSSGFDPKQVLVWIPLTATLDAGAMLQLIVLILARDGGWAAVRRAAVGVAYRWKPKRFKYQRPEPGPLLLRQIRRSSVSKAAGFIVEEPREEYEAEQIDPADCHERGRRAIVTVTALILLSAIISLQITGLAFTIIGRREQDLKVSYCSASLDSISVAGYGADVRNSTTGCGTWYNVTVSVNKGIGCVQLPAMRQRDWLLIAAVVLPFSLLFQIADLFIMLSAPNREDESKHWDLRRPWLTMFTGILILIALTAASYYHSMTMPHGISDSVLIFKHDPSADSFGVCTSKFHAAGLRGSILAYFDGILWFLGKLYVGQ